MIKENKTYTLACKCGESTTVSSLNIVTDWRLESNTYPYTIQTISNVVCPKCIKIENDKNYYSENMRDRLKSDYYDVNEETFMVDALEYCGILNHPKASKAFSMAWEEKHSEGCTSVLNYLEELSDLLK